MWKLMLVALAALVSVTLAGYGHGGHSSSFRKQDDHGNYAFGYHIKDPWGASNSRHEKGDGWGNVHGSYSLHDVDGRSRRVHYVADKGGFRAHVQSHEPGVVPHYAANAPYNAHGHGGGGYY